MRFVRSTDKDRRDLARKLRTGMTRGERVLWSRLRGNALGFKVRRQFPSGNFILDFYVLEARLCIELNGPLHEPLADRKRDEALLEMGIQTLRIPLGEFENREEHWIREIQLFVDLRKKSKPWWKDSDFEEDEEEPPP